MISDILAKNIVDSLSDYIDTMRLKFSDDSLLENTATWEDSVVSDEEQKVKRDVKSSFNVADKDGLSVVEIALVGGGQELYKESVDYAISGIDILDVTVTLEYSYDYNA